MAYETGTASGHLDLLEKIVAFVTTNQDLIDDGQNWQVLQHTTDPAQYFLQAPGLSGTEQIYINLATAEDSTNDYYNLLLYGAQGYDSLQQITTQPKTYKQVLTLWNQDIKYWLIANGQRLIIVAKVSTVYTMAYLGKFFPYATPNQYAYPVLIAGDHGSDYARWSDTSAYHRTFQTPGETTATVYLPSGVAQEVRNKNRSDNYQLHSETYAYMMPTHQYSIVTQSTVQQNEDGTYTLIPLTLGSAKDTGNLLGELDGAFWITGHNNASENIITIDSEDYLVVQNINRTSWIDYCAIKLV